MQIFTQGSYTKETSGYNAVQRQRITKSNRSSRRVIGPIAARSPTICYSQATNLIPALLAEYLLSTIRISAYDNKLDSCWELTHDNHEGMSLVIIPGPTLRNVIFGEVRSSRARQVYDR